MEWTDVIGLGASALTGGAGGLVGVIGGLVQKWLGVVEQKRAAEREVELARINSAHELAMADKHLAEIRAEADSAIQLADLARAKETDVAALTAIGAAYATDQASYAKIDPTNKWLVATDVVRGMTRPLAFWHLLLVVDVLAIYILAQVPLDVWADKAFLALTLQQVIASILFMFNAAGCFWFVTRQPAGKAA